MAYRFMMNPLKRASIAFGHRNAHSTPSVPPKIGLGNLFIYFCKLLF